MKKLRKFLAGALPTTLLAAGAAAVSVGVWQISPPGGLICAGGFALAAGWLLIRGGGDGT